MRGAMHAVTRPACMRSPACICAHAQAPAARHWQALRAAAARPPHSNIAMALPAVDVSPFAAPGSGGSAGGALRGAAVESVRTALEQSGFLIVSGHGVPPGVVAAAHAAYHAFYALPPARKLAVAGGFMRTDGKGHLRHAPRGYSPGADDQFAREAFAVQKEDWDPADPFFRSAAAAPWVGDDPAEQNLWPGEGAGGCPPGFRAAIVGYYREMERLAVVLEEILAEALGLPPAYFVERADRSITNMVGFSFGLGQAGVVVPAHDDEGDFTILSHDPALDGSSGLELQLPEDNPWMDQPIRGDLPAAGERERVSQWRAVEPVPGCFIINTGNLMHRFSGGRFQSTMHRVRVAQARGAEHRRQSIAFFHTPNADTMVAPVHGVGAGEGGEDFEPTTSGVLVLERLKVLLPGYGNVEAGGDQHAQGNWEAYLEKNGLSNKPPAPRL
eukprot:SAG22_NODE_126_length_18820_cov_10.207788_5_plen_443_part_00